MQDELQRCTSRTQPQPPLTPCVHEVVELLPLLAELFQTVLIKSGGNLVVESHLINLQEPAGMLGHYIQFIRGPLFNLQM